VKPSPSGANAVIASIVGMPSDLQAVAGKTMPEIPDLDMSSTSLTLKKLTLGPIHHEEQALRSRAAL
jgi:hypothetical protein